MSAPVVNGTIREGGIYWIAALRPDNHDPHRSTEQNEWSYIGESALDADPVSGALRPHLFTSWEIADHDGLSLVFKLHPKIFIHDKPPWDARQFTAEDAAWNLERLAGLHAERLNLSRTSFQGASLFANMTKARMIDPLTVKVTLSRPNSAFFSALTDTHAVMVPKEMDDIGWRDPLRFAGTGPWVTTEWTPDGAALYKRALGYSQFRAGEPHFECLRSLAEYADTAGQHAAFLVDKFQAVDVARPATLAAMRAARPDALLYSWTGRTSELIRFNMGYAPFRDARVRQAFHLAVDYEADAEAAFGPGGGWAYRAALHPGHPEAWETERVQGMVGYNPNSRQRDLATAQKLLAAAGFPDGAGIDFEMLASRTAVETRQRFAASMHRTFPRMQINTTAAAAESQAATARWGLSADAVAALPDAALEAATHYGTGGRLNAGRFSDAAADRLLDQAMVELDPEARARILDDFQHRWFADWRPLIAVHAEAAKTLVHSNVAGYDRIAGTWQTDGGAQNLGRLFFVGPSRGTARPPGA